MIRCLGRGARGRNRSAAVQPARLRFRPSSGRMSAADALGVLAGAAAPHTGASDGYGWGDGDDGWQHAHAPVGDDGEDGNWRQHARAPDEPHPDELALPPEPASEVETVLSSAGFARQCSQYSPRFVASHFSLERGEGAGAVAVLRYWAEELGPRQTEELDCRHVVALYRGFGGPGSPTAAAAEAAELGFQIEYQRYPALKSRRCILRALASDASTRELWVQTLQRELSILARGHETWSPGGVNRPPPSPRCSGVVGGDSSDDDGQNMGRRPARQLQRELDSSSDDDEEAGGVGWEAGGGPRPPASHVGQRSSRPSTGAWCAAGVFRAAPLRWRHDGGMRS